MTTTQKIIKNLSIAFAIFLIVIIISSITVLIFSIFGNSEKLGELKELSCNYNENLDLSLNYSNLEIKESDKFLIETNNNNIKCSNKENKLLIKEKRRLFRVRNNSKIIIYVPNNYKFNDVKIENGAGSINIEDMQVNNLDLELGAGKTNINNIKTNNTDIESGAGKLEIKSSLINNLDLDMGVGEIIIEANLTGNTKIDAGIGSLKLDILGKSLDYKIKLDKGIGNVYIDNKKVKDNEVIGNGSNYIDIDGGIGEIKVNFKEETK